MTTYYLFVTIRSKELAKPTNPHYVRADLVIARSDGFDGFAAVGLHGVFEETEILHFGEEVDEYDGVVCVLARRVD